MYCKNCGKEVVAGEKFCKECGTRVENVCPECGCSMEEGARFCGHCGYGMDEPVNGPIPPEAERNPESDVFLKVQKLTSILYLIAAGLLILIGFADVDYAWGDVALCCGIGMLVIGILGLMHKSLKAISINSIVFGALEIMLGLAAETSFFWDVVSIFIGVALLVPGILILLKKAWKTVSIVEIVFGSLVLLVGLGESEYDWGITALIAGAAFLATGIIWFVNLKKMHEPISNGRG